MVLSPNFPAVHRVFLLGGLSAGIVLPPLGVQHAGLRQDSLIVEARRL